MRRVCVALAVLVLPALWITANAASVSIRPQSLSARVEQVQALRHRPDRLQLLKSAGDVVTPGQPQAQSGIRRLETPWVPTDALSQWDWPECGYETENCAWIKSVPLSDVLEPYLWDDWPYGGAPWNGHPVTAGDIVCFGGPGYIRAYDITDGTVLWERSLGGTGYWEGCYAIFSYGGTEYMLAAHYTGGGASGTEAAAGAFRVTDGAPLWTRTWDINMPVWHFATPTIIGTKAYYATFDYDQLNGTIGPGHILEVDLSNGAISSFPQFTTGTGCWSGGQATDGQFMYPACGSYIGPGRVEKWNLTTKTQVAVSQSMGEPAWGGTAYAEVNGIGYVYALSAATQSSGGHVWCFKASDLSLVWSVAVSGGFDCQVPTVTDNGVYVTTYSGGYLYNFDLLTGAKLPGWPAQYVTMPGGYGQDGQLAATGRDGQGERLYVADGVDLWVYDQLTGTALQRVSYTWGSGCCVIRPAGYCIINSWWDDIAVYEIQDRTTLAHDVGVSAILEPSSARVHTGEQITPTVTVTNFGTSDEYDVPVYFVAEREGTPEYTGYREISVLPSGSSVDVNFLPDWEVAALLWHGYTIDAYTDLSGDQNPNNDHRGMICLVTADTLFSNRIMTDAAPTIDGTMSPGEWDEAYAFNASNVFGWFGTPHGPEAAYGWLLHDGNYLYMAYSMPEDPNRSIEDQIQFFCDENNNGVWEMGLTEGQHSIWVNGSLADQVQYRPWMPTSPPSPGTWMPATGSQSASSASSGHMVFEARIPFGSDLWNLNLNPNGDTCGLWLFELAGPVASATWYGWWRSEISDAQCTYPQYYGKLILLPPPEPVVSGVVPDVGPRLWTGDVTIYGSNFAPGASSNFGTGITVNSTTYNSPTQLTANITIAATAPTGPHDVAVTTVGGTATLQGGFTVTNPVPTLTSIVPTSGDRLQTLDVTFDGSNYIQDVTTVSFGTNITVNSVTVTDPTQLSANITIAAAAATGARDVSVTNPAPGGGTATLSGGFTVTNPAPTLTGILPNIGARTATLDVSFTGNNFFGDATTVDFGADITVNSVTVNSLTQLVANITIDASAALGPRDVSVINAGPGGGTATLTDGFTVVEAAPGAFDLLTPPNHATGVPTSGELTWEPADGATTYDVYLGTTSPPPLYDDDIGNVTSYAYSGLAGNRRYYWAIEARNSNPVPTRCNEDFDFTTQAGGVLHDVGVTAVLRPATVVGLGQDVYPRMTVKNFGDVTEGPFNVRCVITDENDAEVFNQVEQIASLASGVSVDFEFENHFWTAEPVGTYHVRCQTELTGDMVPGNDKKEHDFDVVATLHDVGVHTVLAPLGTVRENTTVFPKMTVRNYGTETEGPFAVRCIITDENDAEVFNEAEEIASLASGGSMDFEFTLHSWLATPQGSFQVRCTTELAGDEENLNDWCDRDFVVAPAWSSGWQEVRPVPKTPTEKAVKDGAWIVKHPVTDGDNVLYVAKGNKTTDFYMYDPLAGDSGTWYEKRPIPGTEGTKTKPPSKGCAGVSDGSQYIYVTKGNNTLGFWRYDAASNTWDSLDGVPLGRYNKRVKGGTDMVFALYKDTGCVYLLKGYKTEFYRYNPLASRWDTLPEVPYGMGKQKYDKGSFLVYDGENFIYAHQAKYYDKSAENPHHYMFRYDIAGDSWYRTAKKGIPVYALEGGRTKKKKSADGAAGAWYDGHLYALKGGNTQGFFKYFPAGDTWTQLDTVPGNGSTAKKKRVKSGGDLVSWGGGAFFALKGNKTFEFWRYVEGPAALGLPLAANRYGVQAGLSTQRSALSVSPNPLANGWATVRYSLAKPGPVLVTVFDVAGRAVEQQAFSANRTGAMTLDVRRLPAGIYLVRLDAEGLTRTQKLVVQR
ncbi:MAG: T9SS type A sorting domain-containing protein [candidate division WOR-3 bacterium]